MIPIILLYVNYKGGLQLNGLNWFGLKILKKKKIEDKYYGIWSPSDVK